MGNRPLCSKARPVTVGVAGKRADSPSPGRPQPGMAFGPPGRSARKRRGRRRGRPGRSGRPRARAYPVGRRLGHGCPSLSRGSSLAACRALRGAPAATEAERSHPASEPQLGGRELRPSHVPRRPFKQELRSRPGPWPHTAPPAVRRTARSWPAAWCPGGRGGHPASPGPREWTPSGGCGPRADALRGPGRLRTLAGWRGLEIPVSHPGIGPERRQGQCMSFQNFWEFPLAPTSDGESQVYVVTV